MKHRNSHLLVGYWSRLRKGREIPDQTDIDPRAIKRILSHVFILDASQSARPIYRLAGTSHCERYGAELKDASFLNPWEAQSRRALVSLLRQSLNLGQPVCLSSLAASDDCGMIEIETVLAPLTFGGAAPARFLGASHTIGDGGLLKGNPVTFERLVGSQVVRECERSVPFDNDPPLPPPRVSVSRIFQKAPHLRLVASRERPATGQGEMDAAMKRLIEALEIVPGVPLRAVS